MTPGAHAFIYVLLLLTGYVRYATIDTSKYDGDYFRSIVSTTIFITILFLLVEGVGWTIYSIHMWINM